MYVWWKFHLHAVIFPISWVLTHAAMNPAIQDIYFNFLFLALFQPPVLELYKWSWLHGFALGFYYCKSCIIILQKMQIFHSIILKLEMKTDWLFMADFMLPHLLFSLNFYSINQFINHIWILVI